MRLEKLTIHNLASIADATIDFSAEPLASEPVFLICGPTGAGKSTILDAICLALYNEVPRLDNAPNETFRDGTTDYSGRDDGEVKISDTRMLLRRNAVACKVTLTFRDNLGRRFMAEWGCAHARGKLSGRVQSPVWTLSDANGVVVANKIRETQRAIEELVGLNFEQFCRTTMLAQGEFSRFLVSDSNSKSEILEKLTGTGVYSRIGQLIAEHSANATRAVDNLKAQLSNTRLLSGEEIDGHQRRLAAIAEECAGLDLKIKKSNLDLERIKKFEIASLTRVESLNELQQLLEERSSERFKTLQESVDLWNATEELRACIKQRDSLLDELAKLRSGTLEAAMFARCEQARGELSKLYESESAALKQLQASELGQRPLTGVFEKIPLIDALLNDMALSEKATKESSAKLTVETKRSEEVTAELKRINAHLDENDGVTVKLRDSLEKANAALSMIDGDNLAEAIKVNNAELDLCALTADAYKKCEKAADEALRLRQRLATLSDEQKKYNLTAGLLKSQIEDKSKTLADTKKIYDKQKEATDVYMVDLRSRLSVGDDCPLCGQKIENLTDSATFRSILEPVRMAISQLEADLDALNHQFSDVSAKLHGGKTVIATLSDMASRKNSELEVYRAELAERAAGTPYFCDGKFDSEVFGAHSAAVKTRHEQLEESRRRLDVLHAEVSRLNVALSKAMAEKTVLDGALRDNSLALQRHESTIDNLKRVIASEQQKISELKVELWNMATASPQFLEIIAKEDYRRFAAEVKTAARRYKETLSGIEIAEKNAAALDNRLSEIDILRSSILKRRCQWGEMAVVPGSSPWSKADVVAMWRELSEAVVAADTRILTLENQLESNRMAMRGQLERGEMVALAQVEELLRLGTDEINRRKKMLAESDVKLAAVKARHSKAESDAVEAEKELQGAAGADSGAIEQERGVLEVAKDALMMEKGSIEQLLKSDANLRMAHERELLELKRLQGIADDWYRLNALFGSADGRRMRNIAQSWVLEQLASHANHYLRQLSRRYEIATQPGKLSLLVRDNDAGGDLRPASSLSGGESFIVSLALALGLPSLSGSALALDVIFIDEGFGTLDSVTRSVVVDTLERLHRMAGGRRVGVISHVDDLRERLPVKIEVARVSSTLSEVAIVNS